jgi:Baculovirus FP protein
MSSCFKCKKRISAKNPGLQCNGTCKKFYHSMCGGLPDDVFKALSNDLENMSWICKPCKGRRNSVVIRQPVAEEEDDDDDDGAEPGPSSDPDRTKTTNKKKKEDSAVLEAIQKSQDFLSAKVDNLLEQLSALKEENTGLKERVKHLEIKCSSLEYTVYSMERETDTVKREKIASNLLIHGVPYFSNENPTQIVIDIAAKLDHSLGEESILSCSRLTNSNKNNAAKAPLMVKFADISVKRELVMKLRRKKLLLLSEVYPQCPGDDRARISLRDDLTPLQRMLFKEAKGLQELFQLRFAWMKDGEIFVRKEENTKVYAINSKCDLIKIANIFSNK